MDHTSQLMKTLSLELNEKKNSIDVQRQWQSRLSLQIEHFSLGPIKEEGAIWSTQLPLQSSLGAIFCFGRGVKRTNGRSR
jgi:hypothetical protein